MSGVQLPVVVVGAHTVGLGVIRALSHLKIPIISVSYDQKDMGVASKYISERLQAPHPELHEEAFIHFIAKLSARHGRSLLIPTSDVSLMAISRHKCELERDYIVAGAEWTVAERFINKRSTHAIAVAAGVPVPRTVVPSTSEEVEVFGHEIEYPCLVKPCHSHRFFDVFGTKMFRVESFSEMISAHKMATDHQLEVMLQEIIPGDGTCGANYNSYWVDGQPMVEFTGRKVRNAPPDFGSPCVVSSVPVGEVIEPGRKILAAMGFHGYACTEFKLDPRDGVYKLLEVNGRHNLSTLLAVTCGINFPEIHYRHLVLGEVPQSKSYAQDVYWIDLTRDIYYHWFRRRHEKGFFDPYRRKHVFAILDTKDSAPFIKRWADLIKEGLTNRRGKFK